jgi:hypothetical protein
VAPVACTVRSRPDRSPEYQESRRLPCYPPFAIRTGCGRSYPILSRR